MLAVKAFNSKLQATMGKGIVQFEPGGTYEEPECNCAQNGYHCAEDPLDVLNYYGSMDDRFFIVKAEGEIHQDGHGSRISCTRLTLVKEISRIQLAAMACRYMEKYPDRKTNSRYLAKEKGKCRTKGDFIIVRGKHPKAAGVEGSVVFLMQEAKDSTEIIGIYPIEIDGKDYREGTWYGVRGGRICARKRSEA